jgi:large subunit ribosomal protein L17
MMRNMVTSLLEHDRITTTDARAKELRKLADRMITLAKRGDLHARRQALQVVQDRKVVAKLFDRLAPRYQERPGGYTRIIKLGSRPGDNASLSIIELVEEEYSAQPTGTGDEGSSSAEKSEGTPQGADEQAKEA